MAFIASRPTGLLLLGGILVAIGGATCGVARGQFPGAGPAAAEASADFAGGIVVPENRALRSRLDVIRKRIESKHYAEAARNLGALLESPDTKDFFLKPADARASHRSFQWEIRRLLGELPPEGRQSYELQFGTKAQQLLDEALHSGDVGKLQEVVRRYTHTRAGYEALFLLGCWEQQHDRMREAAVCFRRLQQAPDGGAAYEPQLSLLLADCWLREGDPAAAANVLEKLKAAHPEAVLLVAGQAAPLFAERGAALDWLSKLLPGREAPENLAQQWRTYRGGPSRNRATAAGGLPLMASRWHPSPRISDDAAVRTKIAGEREMLAAGSAVPLPMLHPVAVDDLLLVPAAGGVQAVDLQSGHPLWPEGGDDLSSAGVAQRVWRDAAFGAPVTDGRYAFVVQGTPPVPGDFGGQQNIVAFGGWFGRFRGGWGPMWGGGGYVASTPSGQQTLRALDLRAQGALRWTVGGNDGGNEPRLAGVLFLGPPLPLAGRLYALVENDGALRLAVLDALSGRLEWSQELAAVENSVDSDPFRRMAGATPSIADGVIVCPTSSGGVVAVEQATRSLLWAYQYPRLQETRFEPNQGMLPQMQQGKRWVDATATIAAGRVLLTPMESGEIHCLDLWDGRQLWKKPRGDYLYLACVHADHVVLVGGTQVTALRLKDGQRAWKRSLRLPGDARPSGRGVYGGKHYYLPLTDASIAQIDLDSGELTGQARSRRGFEPGNLIWHRGAFISLGTTYLEAFDELEPLRRRVTQQLAASPDPVALARLADIHLAEGKVAEAIGHLQHAYRISPSDELRSQLVAALQDGVRAALPNRRELEAQLDALARP